MSRGISMPQMLAPTAVAIERAATALRAGEVVGVPTETVYGLAGDARNPHAVARIFALKGRPSDNPLIVHVADSNTARALASMWDARCDALAEAFWPGPLTLVLPMATGAVTAAVTAGWPTIAVRVPKHPVMLAVLRAFGGGLAAPSANHSSHVSPTRAEHVAAEFADEAELLILNGGPCEVGVESTVLEVFPEHGPARVLRPGAVTLDMLRRVIGEVCSVDSVDTKQTQSPGSTARHYAPQTPCELVESSELSLRLSQLHERCAVLCIGSRTVPPPHEAIAMPSEAEPYARELYSALRHADARGAARIVIEQPAATEGLWQAILDRLRRATAPR